MSRQPASVRSIARRACGFCRPAAAHGVRVIKTNEAFAIRRMRRQRIIDAIRALFRRLDALEEELDPVVADRIDKQHDAIKRQKIVASGLCFGFAIRSIVIS